MSRLIDDSVTQALATARAALADTALAADLAAAQPGARAALREETTETWQFDSAPTNVIGLVVVDTGRQVARSVKIQNIAIRPMLALRNALGGCSRWRRWPPAAH